MRKMAAYFPEFERLVLSWPAVNDDLYLLSLGVEECPRVRIFIENEENSLNYDKNLWPSYAGRVLPVLYPSFNVFFPRNNFQINDKYYIKRC